ncbi:MAG: hypothetical protein MUF18_11605, partial [Fimbriiglobus sp.]|nr:hypothetical protein [Fimbriiglobus sp.]
MAFFDREVEEAVLAKRWETDCTEMTLTQNATENPRVHRGKGLLRQNAEGGLCFRIYPPGDGPLEGTFDKCSERITAGQLVPDDEFYTLRATDWGGRVWTCAQVHPKISTTGCSGTLYGMISGEAFDLRCEIAEHNIGKSYFLRMVLD